MAERKTHKVFPVKNLVRLSKEPYPRRFFGFFLIAQKETRPAGRNFPQFDSLSQPMLYFPYQPSEVGL